MKNHALFLLSLLFLQSSVAGLSGGGFKVEIISRTPDDEDKNAYIVAINGKTSLGLKEMEAFKGCVLDITVVNPLVYGQSESEKKKNTDDLLKLTETASVKELNSVLKDLTCKLYQAQNDPDSSDKDKIIILTTPTDEGLSGLIEGPLTDCLSTLDDSLKITVQTRKQNLKIPEETLRKNSEERYCPKD